MLKAGSTISIPCVEAKWTLHMVMVLRQIQWLPHLPLIRVRPLQGEAVGGPKITNFKTKIKNRINQFLRF
ncbi:hypothetical protein F0562_030638 [Nyssa sinensis]|uniref:Uncharacterized protein n=1 Tax=Nyssa sinensis TaxID=561372 RepID=A0A5J5AWZ4_9ASTE|nr:hypothetical protein F0562_030638 [Nyssa sinensis]